jgi:hypothetical protein
MLHIICLASGRLSRAARHAAQGSRSNVQQKAEDSDEDIVGPQVLRACMSARACVFGACVIVRACVRARENICACART